LNLNDFEIEYTVGGELKHKIIVAQDSNLAVITFIANFVKSFSAETYILGARRLNTIGGEIQ